MNPVTVPEASELALRYYRSGNVIWAIEQVLGLALPALLLFTGLSARLRTFASIVGARALLSDAGRLHGAAWRCCCSSCSCR